MERLSSTRHSKPALSRREFLALGSAGFLAVAAPTLRGRADVQAPGPSAKFKDKLVLFGVRRGNEKTSTIESLQVDVRDVETILRFEAGVGFGRVSPGRDRIVFQTLGQNEDETSRSDLWMMHADGGGGVLVENAENPCWSHDGKRIAFSRGEPGNWENLIVDVESKKLEKIPLPATDAVYDWSPDGTELLTISHRDGGIYNDVRPGTWWSLRQVYRTRLDGSHPVRLTDLELDQIWPRFSPNAQHVAYECRRVENGKTYLTCRVVDHGGKNPREVINFTELGISPRWSPSWSPDDKRLVWLASKRVQDTGRRYDFELVFVNHDGTELRRQPLGGVQRIANVDWA